MSMPLKIAPKIECSSEIGLESGKSEFSPRILHNFFLPSLHVIEQEQTAFELTASTIIYQHNYKIFQRLGFAKFYFLLLFGLISVHTCNYLITVDDNRIFTNIEPRAKYALQSRALAHKKVQLTHLCRKNKQAYWVTLKSRVNCQSRNYRVGGPIQSIFVPAE